MPVIAVQILIDMDLGCTISWEQSYLKIDYGNVVIEMHREKARELLKALDCALKEDP